MGISSKLTGLIQKSGQTILDGLFPPQCPCCQDSVSTPGTLCANCWGKITFISKPTCFGCGLPFEYDMDAEALCGHCIRARPSFERAISVLRYDENSRDMILAFKHGDQTDQTISFATWMARAGQELFENNPCLVPVPLHPKRLLKRRFNQSALLAREIADQTGLEVDTLSLKRIRHTDSQGNKNLKARTRNVKGAFEITPKGRECLSGRHVVLIDDVYTTGSTLEECSKTLLRAGATSVSALTLGRVVRASVV